MNAVNKDELFEQVSGFLRKKGIDLHDGSYTRTIQQGCELLADTVNLSQQAFQRARAEVEKTLEQVRQTVHQKTAAKPPPASAEPASASGEPTRGKATRRPQPRRPRAGAHRRQSSRSRPKSSGE